jgi:MFS family permease
VPRLPVLRHRDFRLLFYGQAVSVLGDALFPVALAFAVLDGLDGSPAELGFVLAAQVVPMTFLVLVAGVWADRVSRRRLMLLSDAGRCAVQATAAALLLTGAAELWHLIVLVALYGSFEAFFRPASAG